MDNNWENDNHEEKETVDFAELERQRAREYRIELKARVPLFTYILIAVNLIIGALLYLYSQQSGISYDELLFDFGAKVNTSILAGEYWRFITPVFLHANLMHLVINCYSLYVFGSNVERILGRFRFIAVYLIAGLFGNIASFMFSLNPSVGASGAIFGLLGTMLYFGLDKPVLFKVYFGYNVLITVFANLAYGFSRSGIDNYAHIGGLVGGFLTSGLATKSEKSRWYTNKFLYFILSALLAFSGLVYGFNSKASQVLTKMNQLESLEREEDWSKAELKAEEILELDPGDSYIKAALLWSLTVAEAMNRKYDEASEHAIMLIEVDPPNGHYILGLIYFDTGKYTEAEEQLLKAKEAGAESQQIDTVLEELNKIKSGE